MTISQRHCLKKGRVAEAMVHYRKLLEIEPENVEARNTLGTALIQHGHVKEAIDEWQDVLAIQPENGNAASNLAWVFATCPEDSIRDGTRAVELARESSSYSGGKIAMIYRVLAAAYAESGRFAEAIETAQRGTELAIPRAFLRWPPSWKAISLFTNPADRCVIQHSKWQLVALARAA